MSSNALGQVFRFTTWGESHGKAMGVVIDGCPAGVALDLCDINTALAKRAPGKTPYTSPRKEPDCAQIYSGVFEGQTTGAPISIMIENCDPVPEQYQAVKRVIRPGHANYTYLKKYGVLDHRGGGRASARETVCRVAAGAVAQKILDSLGVTIVSYLQQIGHVALDEAVALPGMLADSLIFCPDPVTEQAMLKVLSEVKEAGDSLGGIVGFQADGLPVGLGEPVYEKLEANLAKAMLSIPATKGFEIGEGFAAASMRGSEHNDPFIAMAGQPTRTNHAGGTLGGISTGMPLVGRVAFKPTSSIRLKQETVDHEGGATTLELPATARHDPCVAIRAVPVVQAMCQIVLADALLLDRCARLGG